MKRIFVPLFLGAALLVGTPSENFLLSFNPNSWISTAEAADNAQKHSKPAQLPKAKKPKKPKKTPPPPIVVIQ